VGPEKLRQFLVFWVGCIPITAFFFFWGGGGNSGLLSLFSHSWGKMYSFMVLFSTGTNLSPQWGFTKNMTVVTKEYSMQSSKIHVCKLWKNIWIVVSQYITAEFMYSWDVQASDIPELGLQETILPLEATSATPLLFLQEKMFSKTREKN